MAWQLGYERRDLRGWLIGKEYKNRRKRLREDDQIESDGIESRYKRDLQGEVGKPQK